MPTTVELTTLLSCPPDEAWAKLQTSALLMHIAAPLIRFTPKDGTTFPKVWQLGEHRAWMWLFGFIPVGWQAVVISEPAPQGDARFVRDNGYGPLIKRWDHWITIAPGAQGGTSYTDRVEIEAGLLTPLIAAFARLFYAHRQRRWCRLAQTGFAALDA